MRHYDLVIIGVEQLVKRLQYIGSKLTGKRVDLRRPQIIGRDAEPPDRQRGQTDE